MKEKSFFSLLFIFFVSTINAQNWTTDLDSAKTIATEKNRNIVLVFQGSDWCAPCIRLDREIWTSKEFTAYANEHFVMLKADFPRKKANQLSLEQQEKNKVLAEKYNTAGYFPFIVVLDKEGKVLGNTGYKKISPAEFIKLLSAF